MKESKVRLQALPGSSAANNNTKQIQYFEDIRDPQKSMVQLVDSLFDSLQTYAHDTNKQNGDSRLHLHCQRPILEKPTHSKSWLKNLPESPVFTGKIYTCDWSLIIKGTNDTITSFVIPSDRVISFNTEPEIYTPYLTISYAKKGNSLNWQIDKEIITHEHIDDLAQRLLERLLKSARSQEWSQSVFCLKSIGIGLASLHDQELEISRNLNETTPDPEQFLLELMKATEPDHKADEFKIATDSEEKVALLEQGIASEQNFESVLKSLPLVLDKKLKELTKEGGEAFSKHDLKAAQEIITLSNQLSEFKNKALEIMNIFKI